MGTQLGTGIAREAGNRLRPDRAANAEGLTRALIVEDRRLLAESLQTVLSSASVICQLVTDPDLEAVESAVSSFDPTVAVVAVGIGSGRLTEQVIGRLCERGVPVVAMTGGADRLRLARCVEEGAVAILDKSMDVATLVQLVRDAGNFERLVSRSESYRLDDELRQYRARRRAERKPLELLTPRERSVLLELTRGLRPDEIAQRCYVSLNTVRSQIKSILSKLGVHSQVQAVAMATRLHWFDDSTEPV